MVENNCKNWVCKKINFLFEFLVEKVVVVICDFFFVLLLRDEVFILDVVGCLFEGMGKGFVVWVKDNVMSMGFDVLVEMIMILVLVFVNIKL